MKTKIILVLILFAFSKIVIAQDIRELSFGKPFSIVNLKSSEGTKAVNGQWKFSNTTIVEQSFNEPGSSKTDNLKLYPTGKSIVTHNITPKAGAIDFDDKSWENLSPESLEDRKGTGLLSYVWYRINVTIPSTLAGNSVEGATVYFEIVMDDYAEVFVNGKLNKTFGDANGQTISGYNSRNRIVLTNNAKAGEQFQIAVLGINGPIADLPDNYIWIRSATLDFYKQKPVNPDWDSIGQIEKDDSALETILSSNAKVTKLADGFSFTEGPVWHNDGFLLFSDPNQNVIYKYDPITSNVSVYITKSGYAGMDIGERQQPGSNGLTLDKEGRLVVCQHGNRRVIRHEKKGPITILSDNWEGKKLNSPNDIVLRSDGIVYFTDPPYGLPNFYNDKTKETPIQGVYAIINGKTILLAKDLGGPNGIAFSPDEKYLYVSNWDIRDIHNTKVIWKYEVQKDGTLKNGREFFSMNNTPGDEALDGLKVDNQGNIFCSAPGGIWIISAQGKLLGKITAPERPANMAWGGKDGKTLYLTAHTSLYKIETLTGK
jgi:gluconolactonase